MHSKIWELVLIGNNTNVYQTTQQPTCKGLLLPCEDHPNNQYIFTTFNWIPSKIIRILHLCGSAFVIVNSVPSFGTKPFARSAGFRRLYYYSVCISVPRLFLFICTRSISNPVLHIAKICLSFNLILP